MRKIATLLLAAAVICGLLYGCVTRDPQRAYASQSNDSKIVFRSVNMPMAVEFGLSASTKGCDGFERVGFVRDTGRGVLLPWIAKLSEKANRIPNSIEAGIPSDRIIQVKGYSAWEGVGSSGHCGPLVGRFAAGHARDYAVDFVWAGTSSCELRITDITVLADVKAVPMQRSFCPRPSSLF